MFNQTKLRDLINRAMTAQAEYSEANAVSKQFRDYDACARSARSLNEANQQLDQYLNAGEQQDIRSCPPTPAAGDQTNLREGSTVRVQGVGEL
jgi:hypothetical protein